MSRFSASFAACGLPGLMHEFGQSASYAPVNRPAVSLTAIVKPEEQRVETDSGARVVARRCEATITDDPDSSYGGVTAANEGATFTFGDEEWAVESVSRTTGGWVLSLVRDELTEQARPEYRGGFA